MKINASKSALANLIDQILADNVGKSLTEAQFTAGVPAVVAGTGGRNTEVTLTAVVGQGYTGSVTFAYTRLDLDSGTASPVTSVEVLLADDQAASLAKVIAAKGLVAAEVEGSAYTAPVDDTTPGTITITPKADSVLYVGGPVVIELTVPAADPDMGETFATTDLNGFEPETVA